MNARIVVGTRGSDLALAQSRQLIERMRALFPRLGIEQRVVRTAGDKRLDLELRDAVGRGGLDKGLFTKELEDELLAGGVDLAVHSLKDLPTALPPGLMLGGVLERADEGDVLVSRRPGGLAAIAAGAEVATGSLRRQLQLEIARPDLSVIGIRGNLPTRLGKLARGEAGAAIILAAAGLGRLGLPTRGRLEVERVTLHCEPLDRLMLPAVGQGVIGIECRRDDQRARRLLRRLRDRGTWRRSVAERTLLSALGGGCQMPLGVRSGISGDMLSLEAVLCSGDGGEPVRAASRGAVGSPAAVGRKLAAKLKRRMKHESK